MGYTHYWDNTAFTRAQWGEALSRAQKIIDASGIPLQYEYNVPTSPLLDSHMIRFNGVGDDGHETFTFVFEGSDFGFCKTARKPYDTVVVAILRMLMDVNPDFKWSSDGEYVDHVDGLALYARAILPEEEPEERHVYIVPAFFEVYADTPEEALVLATAAQEDANNMLGVDLLLDEELPVMKLPISSTLHTLLSLLEIKPVKGV